MNELLGVIGLGEMGGSITDHWLNDGYDVRVYDIDDEKVAEMVEKGATSSDSPKELAKACDIVFIAVGFGDQVEEVIFENEGIIYGIDSGNTIVICSTVHPKRCENWAERIPDDVSLVDAPIARGREIQNREVLVFVGGPEEDVERVRPYLDAISTNVVYLGNTGTGQMGKAANNLLLWACHTANYEALRLAKAYGVDTDSLREGLKQSSGSNYALSRWQKATGKWAEDDLRIISDLSEEYNMKMPQSAITQKAMESHEMDDIWNLRPIEYE